MDLGNKVERSDVWKRIYDIVNKIPRKEVEGDVVDAPSAATEIEQLLLSMENRSCPCNHLDEPCTSNCTCKNPLSSHGCNYCATYGSKEQQKSAAEYIQEKIIAK